MAEDKHPNPALGTAATSHSDSQSASPISPERWQQAKELFEAAQELDPGERASFLNRTCPDDPALREAVESLLSSDRRAGDFLERPILADAGPTQSAAIRAGSLSPGQVLSGWFRVIRFLGQGGMGEVYEAKDLDLGVRVALKTIRPEIASEPRTMARFKQEIQLARRVNHPNVCRMFDLGRHRPSPETDPSAGEVTFLSMELLEGETLTARLRSKRMTTTEALPLVEQMAGALAAAHDVGVVHRDFKPGNVMLVPSKSGDGKERAVVTDFGLAKAVASADQATREGPASSVTATGHVIGTVAYMAPEQLQGEATPASDIYALGLVMYEMVAGKRPLPDGALPGGAYQLDPRWEAAILRCLEPDPADRFPSASEVVAALHAQSVPLKIGRSRTLERPSIKRRAALLAALLVTGIGVAWWRPWLRTELELSNELQLTEDGTEKGNLVVTDASWVYFEEKVGIETHTILVKAPLSRPGPEQEMQTGFHDVHLLGISPNTQELLVTKVESKYRGPSPTDTVWLLPTSGASPRRLGDVTTDVAAWSPDGKHIAYAQKDELWQVDANGSNPRRLATASARIRSVFWSPDGRLLRFDTYDYATQHVIWGVGVSGFRQWSPPLSPDGFAIYPLGWTPDGKYFVVDRGDSTTWLLPEKPGFFASSAAIRFLSGQPSLASISPDGKKAYVIERGSKRYTLMRLEPRVKAVFQLPGFSDVSAFDPAFSRDAKWIAYSRGGTGELWESRADGTGPRQQLTFEGLAGVLPAWSPDGKDIAFAGRKGGEPTRIYLIPQDGGNPKLLVADNLWLYDPQARDGWQGGPTWSPDGTQIAFGENGNDFPIPAGCAIHVYNLHTQGLSKLPGSEGLWTARWSPQERYLAATTRDNEKLMLYDFKTQKWSLLDDGFIGDNPLWSHDGNYLYYMKPRAEPPAILRVRVPEGKPERVADLSVLAQQQGIFTKWSSLTPDGTLLLIKVDSNEEIYSYDLKLR